MIHCLIVHGSWEAQGRWLSLWEPPDFPWEPPDCERYLRIHPPLHVGVDATRILEASDLADCVHLEYVQHLDGGVAIFLPGLIGLASRDSLEVARYLWSTRFRPARRLDYVIARERLVSGRGLVREVRRRAMAHEAGHAMRAEFCTPTPYRDEELAADYLAGQLDAVLGWRPDLGALIFETIGCTGANCSHPLPRARRAAYLAGYRDRRSALPANDGSTWPSSI